MVTAWRQHAPWADDSDVEQDLVISRAIVDPYSDPVIKEQTAFRGGTALHKIVLAPATRYSDDIDLVFLRNEAIGPVLERIRETLSWIEPTPHYRVVEFPKFYFRFTTEAGPRRRLKVELATRETFSAHRTVEVPYAVETRYFTGRATVRTYPLEELLATKLRALYQRKKGRDLYDLWYAAQQRDIDMDRLFELFSEYWIASGRAPLRRHEMTGNMADKARRGIFADVLPLLVPGAVYHPDAAQAWFAKTVLPRFPA